MGTQQWRALFLAAIPGSLVCKALTGIGGFLVSWVVSFKLPQLEYENLAPRPPSGKNSSVVRMIQGSTKRNKSRELFASYAQTEPVVLLQMLFDIWKHFYLVNIWMVLFLVLGRDCLSD